MHVISSGMKAVYKQRPQTVKRYLSVLPYDVLFTARVDGEATRDNKTNGITAFQFTDANGTLANVQPGHTIAIGSTPGASDVGLLRVRKAPTSDTFYVGETAPGEVPVDDGLYITVYDDFTRWSVKPRLVSTSNGLDFEEYHDYDVAYDDQNREIEPIVNVVGSVVDAGTTQFVPVTHAGWVDTGQTYRTVTLDCSLSEMVGVGATLATIAWDVNDWAVTGGGTAQASITFEMPVGFAFVTCTITDSNGATRTRRIPLWTHDDNYPPLTQFSVTRDNRRQWREMELEFFGAQDTSRSSIPYSCMVCYWEVADFGGDTPPDGYISQFLGWVTGDELDVVKYKPRRRVSIAGLGWWLDHIKGYLTTISDAGSPSRWWEFVNPTVDLIIHYVLRETTTALNVANLFLSGVTDPVAAEDINAGSVWRQISDLASGYMGNVGTDSGGGVWLRKHYSFLEWTDAYLGAEERSAVPTLVSLNRADWQQAPGLTLPRRQYKPVGWVIADGSWYVDGQPSRPLYSRAPGLTPADGADETTMPYQRVGGANEQVAQTRLNMMGGHYFARENREIEDFSLPLLDNLDAAEPCWGVPLSLTWVEENGATEATHTGQFLVTAVDVRHSNERGRPAKQVTWTLEQVTQGYPGDAYYPPGFTWPGWAFPDINFIWPNFNINLNVNINITGEALYDFGAQNGPVAAILTDGTLFRTEDFYDKSSPVVWGEALDLGVDYIGAAARDPYSPAYRPPYTSNNVRACIVYGSVYDPLIEEIQLNDPVIGILADIGGTPSIINAYTLPGVNAIYFPKILYHPGVKGLIVVSGQIARAGIGTGIDRADAVYISSDGGQTWTEFVFDNTVTGTEFNTMTAYGPGVMLYRGSTAVEVAAMYQSDPEDDDTLRVRPYRSTDGGATFSLRTEAQIPYLSGGGLGTVWPSLTTQSNDDLALVLRHPGDGIHALYRSYRADEFADLSDITPSLGSDVMIPIETIGNSVAFAAGQRERALFIGRARTNDAVRAIFGTDKLTRMNASQWWPIAQGGGWTGAILDRNGKAGYVFGDNGSIGFIEPFPLGTPFPRSIPDTSARVLELVALPAIVMPSPYDWEYTVDFTEEAGLWVEWDYGTNTAKETANRDAQGWHTDGGNALGLWLITPSGFEATTNLTEFVVEFVATEAGPGASGSTLLYQQYLLGDGDLPDTNQGWVDIPVAAGPYTADFKHDGFLGLNVAIFRIFGADAPPCVVTSITIRGVGTNPYA